MANQRLNDLRNYMKQEKVDICLIYSTDDHNCEYISDHFKYRDYLSGFTGSAATMAVTSDEAFLWTDGRYFLQAAMELENSDITLQKSGEKNIPTPEEFVADYLKDGAVLGIDARVVSANTGKTLAETAREKNAFIKTDFYYSEHVWEGRPQKPANPVFILDEKYAGKSAVEKINDLKKELHLSENDAYILSSIDNIAWLLNLRGSDIHYNPVFYSYFYMDQEESALFINKNQLSDEVCRYLSGLQVNIEDYEDIFHYFTKIYAKIYCDENHSNYAIYSYIKEKGEVVSINDPVTAFKAVKNETEIQNIRYCNELDGAAVVRFIKWIREEVKHQEINEFEASLAIDRFRAENESFIEPSFETICGYKENGAIVHYSAPEEGSKALEPDGALLVDSGGQYPFGTTDITRTFSLGEISEKFKTDFTLVLKGVLNLQNGVFTEGCMGLNLDIIAREPLWQYYKDYNHGTGHGIGYCLNVHESPVNINKRLPVGGCVMKPGMIVSDEPGLYIENEYGIRTENMLLCKKLSENEFGTFLGFEPLTYAPIDLNCIKPELLSAQEKEYLNSYHKLVFEKLSPHLNKEEKEWLKDNTKAIS